MIIGAVLAGGSGTRMGSGALPKQFMKIGGKEILQVTVENMLTYREFSKLLILTPEAWIPHTEEILRAVTIRGQEGLLEIIRGGGTRTETLMNAVRRAEELSEGDDTILVTHDAVRPFVTERMIRESVEAARRCGASVAAIPAVDTVLESGDGKTVDKVPERNRLFNAQTPQTFLVSSLREIFDDLTEAEKDKLTDGTSIFTVRGFPVAIVPGSRSNMKITYPADLAFAEAVMESRRERPVEGESI